MNPPVRLSFNPKRPVPQDGHFLFSGSVARSNASTGYGASRFRSSSFPFSVSSVTNFICFSKKVSSSPKKCTPKVASRTSTTRDVRTSFKFSTSTVNGVQNARRKSRHLRSPFATSSKAFSNAAVNP